MASLRISAIVPTLDEEGTIAATLEDISRRGFHEVIVVDGGSRDATRARACGKGARCLLEEGGLARQLNRGAAEATGDVLLFHHADLRLGEGALESLRRALERPEVVGGAFALGFDSPRAVYRWIARGASLRNRLGFGPFGDQAIFARKEVFDRVGGFPPAGAFEDLELVRLLRRDGRFVILRPPVRASVRRWERDGLLRTAWAHGKASLLYLLGWRRRAGALKRSLQTRREEGADGGLPGGVAGSGKEW